jgi:hypothetical protein
MVLLRSHAVQLIQRNIELIRYKLFTDDLLLELVNVVCGGRIHCTFVIRSQKV